jgi:hypothetical protein
VRRKVEHFTCERARLDCETYDARDELVRRLDGSAVPGLELRK